jgi:ribosomal protein L11 methyltransferase
VLALDFDPLAVQATAANAAVNGVTVDVRRFDLLAEQTPDADLVIANVLAGPLLSWAGLQERLPTRLILSGLLTGETERVATAYAARGMTLVETRVSGDWAALMLVR